MGHVARVCHSDRNSHPKQPKRLQSKRAEVQDKATVLTLCGLAAQLNPPLLIVLAVDGIPLATRVKTSASYQVSQTPRERRIGPQLSAMVQTEAQPL